MAKTAAYVELKDGRIFQVKHLRFADMDRAWLLLNDWRMDKITLVSAESVFIEISVPIEEVDLSSKEAFLELNSTWGAD